MFKGFYRSCYFSIANLPDFLTTSSLSLFFSPINHTFERHKICRMLGAFYLEVFQVVIQIVRFSAILLLLHYTKNMTEPKILANTNLSCTESTIIYFQTIMHNAMVFLFLLSH